MLAALRTPGGRDIDIALTTNGSALAAKAQALKDAGLTRVTARHFKGSPHILRFIELMDVGTSNGWRMSHVVPSAEVVSRINAELPLEEVAPNYKGVPSCAMAVRTKSSPPS